MISTSCPAKVRKPRWAALGLCLALGLAILSLPACGPSSSKKAQGPPEKLTVKGPDTVASEWVDAFRARDFVALKDLSSGHVRGIVEEILRRRRLDNGLFQTLSTHYPNLGRSRFDTMITSTTEERFTEATVDPVLDGFLESPDEQTRIYQVGHRDEHDRQAYHRLTVSQGEGGRWTVSAVDDERFGAIVKIHARNGNLTLERSFGRLAAFLSENKVPTFEGAIMELQKIAQEVESEMADDAK